MAPGGEPPRYESADADLHLKEFIAWTGRSDDEIPSKGEVIEYLWGEIPLRYGDSPEVAEEHRVTIGQYLSRINRETAALIDNVAWDKRTFQRRMRDVNRISRAIWLAELRQLVRNEGFTPRADAPWATAEYPSVLLYVEDAPPVDLPQGFRGFPPFEKLASECAAIADIKALVDVIGSGAKLTAKGNLGMAEARILADRIGVGTDFDERIGDKVFKTKSSTEIELVDLAFRWARAAGFVKVAKGSVSTTKRGKTLGTKIPEEWWSLFVSFVRELRWPAKRWPSDREPFWANEVADLWRYYLESLRPPAGIDINLLTERAWRTVAFIYDVDDLTRDQVEWQISMIESSIRNGFFGPLLMLNAIQPASIDSEFIKPTALGRWAAERFIHVMESDRNTSPTADEASNVVRLHDFRKPNGK